MIKVNRSNKNPIIHKKDIIPSRDDFEVIGVFNAGVTEYNNKTLLILRIAERVKGQVNKTGVPYFDEKLNKINIKYFHHEDNNIDFSDPRVIKTNNETYLTSISHFRLATSNNGIDFKIDDKPWLEASDSYESYGIEDPRISKINDEYYINYTAVSPSGALTKLISTKNFKEIKRHGIIFMADNKDCAIIPEKINGSYYVLNRPTSISFKRPEIWISKTDNLTSYYDHKLLAAPRINNFDDARIGASCVPFKTKHGWLEIYHGATIEDKYSLGIMLLDLKDPTKILSWPKEPIMIPEMKYEKTGFMNDVIFSCGCLVKNNIVHLYYGAADESLCYATIDLDDIFKIL